MAKLSVQPLNHNHLADLNRFRVCAWPVASASQAELDMIFAAARSHGTGAAVISSCQRMEVFHDEDCRCGAPAGWSGFEALVRLAEVAAGLHSLVLGEAQILGQVRAGLGAASPSVAERGGIAVAAARAFRAETEFNAHTGHLLDRALSLSGVTPRGRVAVVGAGAVGGLVAERTHGLGFEDVTVVARRRPENSWFDPERMRYVPFDQLAEVGPVDVLVTCLGSTARPLEPHELPRVEELVVDLGTPKNVAGGVEAPVLTIADMLADENTRPHSDSRRAALRARLRDLLEKRLEMVASDSRSQLGRLRLEVERIRQDEAVRIARLHPELSPEAVEAITRSLVNQIFHRPTERLRLIEDPSLGARLVDLFAADPGRRVEACS